MDKEQVKFLHSKRGERGLERRQVAEELSVL